MSSSLRIPVDAIVDAMARRARGERVPLSSVLSDDTGAVFDDPSINRVDPTVTPRYAESDFAPVRVQQEAPAPQQEQPDPKDASYLPVDERRKAILAGQTGREIVVTPEYEKLNDVINGRAEPVPGRIMGPGQAPYTRTVQYDEAGQPAPVADVSSVPAVPGNSLGIMPRRLRSAELMDELDAEMSTPAQDRNRRWKSAGLQALHQMGENAQAMIASGRPMDAYGIASILGGGLGGAVAGGVRPELDEEQKRRARIANLGIQVRQTLAAEQEQARTEALRQRYANGGQTAAQLATQQRAFYNFLVKQFPQGYQRGTRRDVDAELDRLGMEPPQPVPKKGGQGRGYVMQPGQVIALPDPVNGGFRYQIPHDASGQPLPDQTTTQRQMTEAERQRIEIQLAQLNLQRARHNLRPVTFDEYMTGGGDTPTEAPAAASEPAPPVTTPKGNNLGIVPRTPKLVVNQDAKPEPVAASGIRARGRRGGDRRNERDIGFAESGVAGAEAQAQEARERAARLKGEGRDDEAAEAERSAAAWDRKAEVERQRLQRAGGGRAGTGRSSAPASFSDPFNIFGKRQ